MEKDIETRKLELDQLRLAEDIRLREAELELKREQFEEDKRSKGFRAQVFSPIGAAVIAGVLGLLGTAASGLFNAKIEREKQQANLLLKLSEESDEVKRARSLLFYAQGGYLDFSTGYTNYLRDKAKLKEDEKIPPPAAPNSQMALVDIPANLNQGLTAANPETLTRIFGQPCDLTAECSPVSSPKLKGLIVTDDVGPFKVTGLKPAVDALRGIFAEVKQKDPALYQQIGSAGMLCCRRVRGGQAVSNHSWGTAIDLMIGGTLAPYGSNKTQAGILSLYPYFNKAKFFWSAEADKKDSMHFEASEELIREWEDKGMLNPQ